MKRKLKVNPDNQEHIAETVYHDAIDDKPFNKDEVKLTSDMLVQGFTN